MVKPLKPALAAFIVILAVVFAHGMRYALSIELYTVVALCVVTTNLRVMESDLLYG